MADATALERAELTIRGVRAELVLANGRITLSKDGPPATSITFAVDQVRGTVLEPASRGGRGWIHIAVVGGSLAPPGELAAMSDPYTLPLTSRGGVTARRLARMVEKHLHERGLPSEPAFATSAASNGRFSSGVALTRGPVVAPHVVAPRADASRLDAPGFDALRVDVPPVDVARGDDRPAPPGADAATSAAASPAPTTPPPSAPAQLDPPPPPWSRTRELAAELRLLGELHDSGVLTDTEFEQAKARILG